MATSTLKTVIETLFDSYGVGRYGTNTGTSAAAFTADTDLGGADGARRIDVGCSVYITGGSSGSAPDDEETRLSSRPKLSTGTANLDPSLTVALANNDTFAVAYKPVTFKTGSGPFAVLPAINDALTLFQWQKRIVPVTSVTDGDVLASGTGDYSEVGDGAISKVAATFPLAERVLRMTGVSANDYIKSATIPVEELESYYFEVTGMIASSGAAADQGTAILYDETNGANITLDATTIDRFEPEILRSPAVQMPSGCEQVTVRLEADNAGDIIDWTNIILRKNESRVFTLADRPQRVMSVGQVRATTEGTWSRRDWDSMTPVDAEPILTDAGIWQLHCSESVTGRALFYEEFVAPGDLTTAAGTTTVPADDIAAVAAVILLNPLRRDPYWAMMYDKAMNRAAQVQHLYDSQNQTVRNTTQRAYPTVRV